MTTTLILRVPVRLKEAVAREALANERTLSQQVRFILAREFAASAQSKDTTTVQ